MDILTYRRGATRQSPRGEKGEIAVVIDWQLRPRNPQREHAG